MVRRVLLRAVIGVQFGENIPAVEAAHDQIGSAVILLQIKAPGFAAAESDSLHLTGAVALGLDVQIQQQLALFVRAQVAYPEDRIALRVSGRLFLGTVQLTCHRDRRVFNRSLVRIADPDAKLVRGNDRNAEIRRGGIFTLFQSCGALDKAAICIAMHIKCITAVICLQSPEAVVHRCQVCIVIRADGFYDLPDLTFGFKDALADSQTLGVACLVALIQSDAVENRQTIFLQLHFKAGKDILRFAQLPLILLHPSIQRDVWFQLFIILDRAQQAAHPV